MRREGVALPSLPSRCDGGAGRDSAVAKRSSIFERIKLDTAVYPVYTSRRDETREGSMHSAIIKLKALFSALKVEATAVIEALDEEYGL